MPKIFFVFLLLFCVSAKSQIKALTNEGRQVILFDNGTWKYDEDSSTGGMNTDDTIKLNNTKFFKSKEASFLVKSKTTNVGVYIDPAKWAFRPKADNETNPEYHFSLKTQDGFAMLISEKTEISLDAMKEVALSNAQKASLDARIVNSEYRTVNGKKVLCLEMKATIRGIKFVYYGYYYSDSTGTNQLLTYSSEALFTKAQKELDTFLNGMVILNN
jgi:hypothetical protein